MRDLDAYSHFPEAVRYEPPKMPPRPKRRFVRYGAYTLSAVLCIGIGWTAAINTPHITPTETTAITPAPTAAATTVPVTPPAVPAPPAELGAGIYRVGPDGIDAGRYSTVGSKHCYIARLKNDSGDHTAIKSNNILRGPGSVTIQNGEFFEIRGTCTFKKAG